MPAPPIPTTCRRRPLQGRSSLTAAHLGTGPQPPVPRHVEDGRAHLHDLQRGAADRALRARRDHRRGRARARRVAARRLSPAPRRPPRAARLRPRGPRGPGERRRGRTPSPPGARGRPAARRPRAQPAGVELGVGHHDRGAAVRHPARVVGLVVGGGVRVGDEDRRAAVRRRPRRSSRRSGRRRGRSRRAPARRAGRSRAGRSAGAGRRAARAARRGRARRWRAGRGTGRPASPSTAASLIERAPSEPPKTSTSGSSAPTPKRARAAGAVGRGRRHGAAGDPVARAVAPLDREGQADAPREGRQQAVGQAEVAVGLGQDERAPARATAASADRAGHVPAAAQHRAGPTSRRIRAGVPTAPAARATRARRLERVACG